MITATANLENDHVHILKLIDVMERITQQSEINVAHLENIVDLIRNFADGLHHAKEEQMLFPKMVEKGFSFEQGPVSVMMRDHEEGRAFVKGMANAIAQYKSGNQGVLEELFMNMKGYIDLLRAHIAKENNVLFRMADRAFSEEEQKLLLSQFKRVEFNPICGGVVNDCIAQINNLALVYLEHPIISILQERQHR